jgi:3-phosphoshikimate 1-carboxyvinyltransferase
MILPLTCNNRNIRGTVLLPGSKSESNRVLIIRSLCEKHFNIHNLSQAMDTQVLQQILEQSSPVADVGPAGTAMRFLTARFAIGEGTRLLTGSERMQQRPIGILADALRGIGADIRYAGKEGFPPLEIRGKKLEGGRIRMDGSVSSQFITAMALVAPYLLKGLTIHFTGGIASRPYLEMTLDIMKHFGVPATWAGPVLTIPPATYQPADFTVEPDWSAASYWYQVAALSETADILLPHLREKSLQGDAAIRKLFYQLGVTTTFKNGTARIRKTKKPFLPSSVELDCESFPDLAQTLAVTFAGLGIECRLTGLKSLRIKETDRITALVNELSKFGVNAVEEDNFSLLIPSSKPGAPLSPVSTYEDHRMAMAFAPLVMRTGRLEIEHPEVVVKSYPGFWKDLGALKVIS